MTFGLSAGAIGLIGAGASVVGGLVASNGASDAAGTQAASADRATQAQKDMFDKQVQLQEPWRQAGVAGLNKLSYLAGLSPTGYSVTPGMVGAGTPGAQQETEAQIRARLAPQFASQGASPVGSGQPAASSVPDWRGAIAQPQYSQVQVESPDGNPQYAWMPNGGNSAGMSNPALDAAVQAELAKQAQQTQQSQAATQQAQSDPSYGSLTQEFGTPYPTTPAFNYENDPGHLFRQQQGEQGLTRAAAAAGRLDSGRYLKDAMRFNQGLASQDYGDAFNRFQTTRSNSIGDWTNQFNAFNTNKSNTFNRLASIAGIGQTATNQMGNAAQNFGSQIGSNIIGAGNALAAGQVGSANAINSGIGQGLSMYQSGQLMNRLFPASTPTYGGSGITGGGGFGTGAAFGNQDYGQFF